MCFSFNSFSPDCSKLYTIHYNNKNHRNTHNAIFGRASKPYRFGFFRIAEDEYILTRYEDKKVLCIGEEGLEMHSLIRSKKPARIKFIKVDKRTYALSIQNEGIQKYITYDGFVFHEYYLGLQASDSILDLGIWILNEVSHIQQPISEISMTNNVALNTSGYLSGFIPKMPIEPSLN